MTTEEKITTLVEKEIAGLAKTPAGLEDGIYISYHLYGRYYIVRIGETEYLGLTAAEAIDKAYRLECKATPSANTVSGMD